jgi:hypothetical protein
MKSFARFVVPCLAIAALAAACDNNDDISNPTTTNTANVRFVNAISDANGNLALTSNGSMVGSSQGFATSGSSFTCSSIPAGTSSFAFGMANTGGTGIASNLGTASYPVLSGGNYTAIATGTSANPQLLFIDNTSTTTAPSGFANVRFVNATGNAVDFYSMAGGSTQLGTATTSGQAGNSYGSYTQVPITNGAFTFTSAGSTTPLTTSTGSFSSGGNYTVVLLPGAGGTGYQTLVLNGSC